MKTIISLAVLALLGLLASCTINPHPMDMTQAVQRPQPVATRKLWQSIMKTQPKKCRQRRRSIKKCLPNTRQTRVSTGSKLRV